MLGNILNKSLSFLLLPIYTRYIAPTDYGAYDLNVAYNTFLFSIIYLDIYGVIMRYMFDYKKDERNKPVFNGIILFLISTILYLFGILIFGRMLGLEYKLFLFAMGFTNNLQLVVGYIARAQGKNAVFVFGGVFGSLITLSLNIILIVYLGQGYWVMYLSSIIGFLINAIIIGRNIKILESLKLKFFDSALFKEMFVYAIPLSINSAAFWFLTGFNRVVISNQLGLAENGLYAVATKFSAIIQLITQGFQMAWQELSFSKANMEKDEMSVFYSKAVNEYINFIYLGLVISLPVIKIAFPFIIDAQYKSALYLIPFALYSTFFSSISSFLASIISTLKKNKYIFTTTLLASIVNVLVILSLINIIGLQAASVSLCIGFFVNVLRRIQLINQFFLLNIDYKRILLSTILFVASLGVYIYGGIMTNLLMFLTFTLFIAYLYRDKLFDVKDSLKK